ncbi:hypothetical protein C2G38_2188963 [Gigaspora rosea]|uniref:BTB domain-containing protein n=1 Tax=Gigaspora rosea TaxID=44941 RepID=A0A397V2N9_9GLOM|nr:hypothetical protein C2G38_2188963 [Gigaspora rosea]
MILKFFEKLSNSYLELNDEEDFNIIIDVNESPNTKIFRAHSIVLKYRSLYFHNELSNINSVENNVKTVNLNMFLPNNLKSLSISLENLDNLFIFNLMLIACELLFEELTECLEAFLIIDR